MAKITVDGLNGLFIQMTKVDTTLESRIRTVMEMAAEVTAESVRDEGAKRFKGKKPGQPLENMVKPGPTFFTGDAAMIEVWPQGTYTGTRGKPRRAETVGFVLEYGRTNMGARRWFKTGTRKATKKVNSIIMELQGGMT
jgi:hypothetical protein